MIYSYKQSFMLICCIGIQTVFAQQDSINAAQPAAATSVAAQAVKVEEKRYLVNIVTKPEGAALTIDGKPVAGCNKTPCNVTLAEGKYRIVADLEQHDKADTTVNVVHNNQNVVMRLKANFGIFELKPAYAKGIGKNSQWRFVINNVQVSSWENRLLPGKYVVKLSHRCYEDINFEFYMGRGKTHIVDMIDYIRLKRGGANGNTPLCTDIAPSGKFGGGIFTDPRDGQKYKAVKIGEQIWMAENLNYDTGDSRCYKNESANCDAYGRLYNWSAAKDACPEGWHLPSKVEWEIMAQNIGGDKVEGKHLKAKSGWSKNGNGSDTYGFAALPGGGFDNSFNGAGFAGSWWSISDNSTKYAYRRGISYDDENASWYNGDKESLFSVRCLWD